MFMRRGVGVLLAVILLGGGVGVLMHNHAADPHPAQCVVLKAFHVHPPAIPHLPGVFRVQEASPLPEPVHETSGFLVFPRGRAPPLFSA